MDYDDYCDNCEPMDEFSKSLNLLVTEEVKSRIKETVDELESLRHEYDLQSAELNKIRNEIRVIKKSCELEVKHAVKVAQREYWFDCAVGDKVYILDRTIKNVKCEKCGNTRKVSVVVDSVEVKAECPICGTYEKQRKMSLTEYSIIERTVSRLQIELTSNHKWIKLWDKECDREYSLEYNKIFKTREECQVAYDEAVASIEGD